MYVMEYTQRSINVPSAKPFISGMGGTSLTRDKISHESGCQLCHSRVCREREKKVAFVSHMTAAYVE
jgi:hypothetical protein